MSGASLPDDPDAWYIYVDETGNLDMSVHKKDATPIFGIGTATYKGHHGQHLWDGLQLRLELEAAGIRLPNGFHAVVDRPSTRHRVIDLILSQAPRLDATLLRKEGAYPYVKVKIKDTHGIYLYKEAWFLHFKYILERIPMGSKVFVIAGTLGSRKEAAAARAALDDVCVQFATRREITLCTWDSSTSWALQVADYAAWSAYRHATRDRCDYYTRLGGLFRSTFMPWGRLKLDEPLSP